MHGVDLPCRGAQCSAAARWTAGCAALQRRMFTATRAGRAEAILRWLRLDFGDDILFENRPPQRSAWDP